MQIFTSIEQSGGLKNVSVEEVVGRIKIHEERLCGYQDKVEEKHFLLKHEKWLAWTKRNDAANSLFSSTRERSCRHGRRRGGRRGRDNTSQTHDNINPWKDKSMSTMR